MGASAASRRPLGIAVVGGLAFSQVVTLYVTPVFYTYLDGSCEVEQAGLRPDAQRRRDRGDDLALPARRPPPVDNPWT